MNSSILSSLCSAVAVNLFIQLADDKQIKKITDAFLDKLRFHRFEILLKFNEDSK